ncbi:MAG: ribbon-helix-helix protein, CopG family [Candidatus Rokubacteria bacterium]|nr:ribbon-helix-helix protein, CopG family [Candidatus Rokubacteria bacterium]
MARLVTTKLRFSEEAYRELRLKAERRGVSLATLVREAVDQYLGRGDAGRGLVLGGDPADRIIGAVIGTADDESVHHDHYLYRWPKKTAAPRAGRLSSGRR